MVKIKVKKLHPDAVIPKFMNKGDAGADLTAVSIQYKDNKLIYGIGLSFEIPDGYCMKIYPRSSIFKTSLRLANDVAIIDSGFRNEVKLIFDIIDDDFFNSYRSIYNFGLKKLKEVENIYKKAFFKKERHLIMVEDFKKNIYDYTFEKFIFEAINHPCNNRLYKIGDRIGQAIIEKLVPTEYIEVEELNMNNDRGGGFGSTNGK